MKRKWMGIGILIGNSGIEGKLNSGNYKNGNGDEKCYNQSHTQPNAPHMITI